MKKALLIDDHEIVREGLRLILEASNRFSMVHEAIDGEQGWQYLIKNQYDIILLDLRMPKMNGLQFLEAMYSSGLQTKVLVFTTYDDSVTLEKLSQYPIDGFLRKDASKHEILEMMDEILDHHKAEGENPIEIFDMRSSLLTAREKQIISAVVRGCASKEIASEFKISERTVKAHLTNIYRKLGVNSRTEAVSMLLQQGSW